MLINVTQKHIDEGKRTKCYACPVALAIREQTPFINAGVGIRTWATSEFSAEYLHLPPRASAFITMFDSGSRMKPFTFDLEMPV